LADDVKAAIVLTREILDEFDSQTLEFADELRKKEPRLRLSHQAAGTGATKDIVTIITATAALAPLIVPIVTVIIKRLFPLRELVVEEDQLADGTRRCKFSMKEK